VNWQELGRILSGKYKEDEGRESMDEETALKRLADKVKASSEAIGGRYNPGKAELVLNIQKAIQTATMIVMCKTAAKNYEIAVTATRAAVRNYRIAAAIAILSMLAAWAAVIVILIVNR